MTAILALVLALAGPTRDAQAREDWMWWWNPTADAPWVARFASPGCIPTGTQLSPGPTTLTVTRADPQWVDRVNVNQQTPGLIAEDANTVAHVYWNGSALVDTRGNAWTQNGTVPQNAATWNAPPSAGVFSDANYYSQGAGSVLSTTGDRYGCAVFTPYSTALGYLLNNGGEGSDGDGLYITATARYESSVPTLKTVATANAAILNQPNVVCWWRTGNTIAVKLNGGTTATLDAAAAETVTSRAPFIGRYLSTTYFFNGQIYEILRGNGACPGGCETWATAVQASVLTKINQGTLTSCPANSLAVSARGAEVWAQGVNAALQSSTSCVANAVQTPWVLSVATCVSDAAVAPDGTTTMDEWTNSIDAGQVFQSISGLPSGTAFTGSVWMSKAATGTATVLVSGTGNASGCACGTSDGSACTASVAVVSFCQGKFTAIGTTPVRGWVSGTYATAGTVAQLSLFPGDYGVSTGTTRFWGAQVEVGSYPTPYIPTTTGTGTRNATAASEPLPDFSASDTACFGVTYTPGQDWNHNSTKVLFSNYTAATTNALNLAVELGTRVNFTVFDNTGTAKSWMWTHGLGASRTTKRIVSCMAAGTLSMYADGVAVGAGSGVGTALQSATLTPLQLGSQAGVAFLDGSISNVRIYPNQTYRAGM